MRRALARVILLLVLGAIVNVAVAWGLPRIGPVRVILSGVEPFPLDHPDVVLLWPASAASIAGCQHFYGWGWDREVVLTTDGHSNRAMERERCGWPMRSMTGRYATGIGFSGAVDVPPWFAGLTSSIFHSQMVCLSPIWTGFAVNTLVFAACAGTIVVVPGKLRRAIRRRRGRCVKCNYDRRGIPDAPCPECGTA